MLGWLEIVEGPVDLRGALSVWRYLVRKHVYQRRKLPASVQNHVFFIEQMIQVPVTRVLNRKETHSWVQSTSRFRQASSSVTRCFLLVPFAPFLLRKVTWELLFLAVTLLPGALVCLWVHGWPTAWTFSASSLTDAISLCSPGHSV